MLGWLLYGLFGRVPSFAKPTARFAKPRPRGNMSSCTVVGGINKVVNFLPGSGKGKAMVLKVFGCVV